MYLDQIYWSFLGALSLSLLSVAAFATWLQSGRRATILYGLSLCFWFAAFASYSFQVGAILAVGILSLTARLDSRARVMRALNGAIIEVLPFGLLLALFVLVWKTTQNPVMRAYYELRLDVLLINLPRSLVRDFGLPVMLDTCAMPSTDLAPG